MRKEASRLVLSSFLVAAGGVGAILLLFDSVLWLYAQPHALALAFFVLADVLLAIFVFVKPGISYLPVGLWGIFQFALMTGNLFVGTAYGVDCEGMPFSQQELSNYLLGVVENAPRDYGFYSISPYAYVLLMMVHLPIAVIGLLGSKKRAVP